MKLDNRLTMVLALIISIGVLAGGWFLGAQPQLTTAAAADTQRQTVSSQNDSTRTQIASLTAENRKLPEMQAQLAALSAAVPQTADTTAFLRIVSSLTQSSGVTLSSFAPSAPVAYVPPTGSAAATTAAPGTTTGASASATPSPTASTGTAATATPAAAPVAGAPYSDAAVTASNFSVITFSLAVSGTSDQVDSFLHSLQNTSRLVLLTSIDKASSDSESGSDWTLNVTVNLYVLTTTPTSSTTTAAATNG